MTALGGFSSGLLGDPYSRWAYLNQLPAFCRELVREMGQHSFDAIISPPSRYPFACAYRKAFRRAMSQAIDLSDKIARISESYAGCGATFEQHRKAYRFHHVPELCDCKSLLIVDDIYWRGVTAAATLFHLRQAGLPPDAKIALACPLWIA